ncbi:hypothetical protein AGMMS49938_04380 [Fibrobacterales bacterium]|nr:hypothetical protein AGMMS49938_04380 [Fibrobacterales bacterium]
MSLFNFRKNQILHSVWESLRRNHFVHKIRNRVVPDPHKKSYSQHGEDIIMLHILNELKIDKWAWLDIGAHHPKRSSNSALFYDMGMRGVNVEANPMLIGEFYRQRKGDVNLNIAVGDTSGSMDFYIMDHPALSTLSKEEAQRYETLGFKIKEVIPVKVMSVADVIHEYLNGKFPEVLSIDAEGYDLNILKSIKWEDVSIGCPVLICVECVPYNNDMVGLDSVYKSEIVAYLTSAACGYTLMAYTTVNAIFIRNK